MADTQENQAEYPQPESQAQAGCPSLSQRSSGRTLQLSLECGNRPETSQDNHEDGASGYALAYANAEILHHLYRTLLYIVSK